MNCFSHQNISAVGVCKACQKGVCAECAIDTGRGLACSAACEIEVNSLSQMVDRGKRIYSIGIKSKLPPTVVLMFLFFGLIFSSAAIFQYITAGKIEYFTLSVGIGFIVFALFAYIRTKNLNLNC